MAATDRHVRIAGNDFDAWVGRLAVPTERQRAKHHLLRCGPLAVPAIRRGFEHPDAVVRAACAKLLDKLCDDDAIPDLVAALDDPDPEVTKLALHALACDACKQGACRPGDDLFVPRAMALVRESPDPGVRVVAIDALFRAARRNPALLADLGPLIELEPIPALRHKARQRFRRLERAR